MVPASRTPRAGYLFFGSMVEISRRLREMAAELGEATPMADRLHAVGLTGLEPAAEAAAASAVAAARRFLLLDLRHVMGIDATTASSFASLRRSLESRSAPLLATLTRPTQEIPPAPPACALRARCCHARPPAYRIPPRCTASPLRPLLTRSCSNHSRDYSPCTAPEGLHPALRIRPVR